MDMLLFFKGVTADLRLQGRDLLADDSLYTAVVVSLFTDARARSSDELPPEFEAEDLRGFWGDGLGEESIGSGFWPAKKIPPASGLGRSSTPAKRWPGWYGTVWPVRWR